MLCRETQVFFFFFSILSLYPVQPQTSGEEPGWKNHLDSDARSGFMSKYMWWNDDLAMWICLVRSSLPVWWRKRVCPFKGRTGDYSPYDFTLKLHPLAQILIQVLFLHTFHLRLCYCGNCGTLKCSPEFLTSNVVTAPQVFSCKWLQLYLHNPASPGLVLQRSSKSLSDSCHHTAATNLTLGLSWFTI